MEIHYGIEEKLLHNDQDMNATQNALLYNCILIFQMTTLGFQTVSEFQHFQFHSNFSKCSGIRQIIGDININ